MRIVVPAGIGDWSWSWSKLYGVRDQITEIGIVDGWPYRTREYVQLCGVPSVDYDKNLNYQMILQFEAAQELDWHHNPTWERIRNLGTGNMLLEANQHLEHGLPLADWLPDLPVYYHYPLHISDTDRGRARQKALRALAPIYEGGCPIVGISCASYRGSEAWKTWRMEEWVEMLRLVIDMGWQPLLLGGNWDDLTYSVACELELPDLVGKTSVPEMVEVLSLLDAYLGFSSGMNVIRTVQDKPAMALWPDFQVELSNSWAPPHMLESRRYVSHLWRPVETVWPVAKRFLEQCGEEAESTRRDSDRPSLFRLLEQEYSTPGKRAADAL